MTIKTILSRCATTIASLLGLRCSPKSSAPPTPTTTCSTSTSEIAELKTLTHQHTSAIMHLASQLAAARSNSISTSYLSNMTQSSAVAELAMKFSANFMEHRSRRAFASLNSMHFNDGDCPSESPPENPHQEAASLPEEEAAFRAACDLLYNVFHSGYFIAPLQLEKNQPNALDSPATPAQNREPPKA